MGNHIPQVSTTIHDCPLRPYEPCFWPRCATPAFFSTLLGASMHIGEKSKRPAWGKWRGVLAASSGGGDRARPLLTCTISVTNYMRVAYVTGATRPHGNKRVAFGHYYRCCRGSPLRLDTDEDPPSDRVLGSTHVALCTGGAAYIGHANFSGTPQPGYVVQGANAGSEATKHDTRAGCRARSRRPHRRPGRTWRPWLRLWPCRRRTRVAQWRQLQPEQ
ncbi:MAG: hypothetical protein ACI9TF_000650 [Paracrocinitomix sp.]|jgi:hypothetical protein